MQAGSRRAWGSTGGFTLLELIGVLAVMGILAGALAPSMVQLMDEGYLVAEEKSLVTIANALQRSITETKRIPSETVADWSAAVASYAALPIGQVVTNDKRIDRRLYIDRQFMNGTNQVFSAYEQSAGLSNAPNSPRMMLVSSLDGALSGNLSTHAHFEAVWEQDSGATFIESKKLLIERVNLASLFHRIVLTNSSSAQVGYRLEDGTENAIAAASGAADGSRSLFVLSGTKLLLMAAPYPSGTVLQQIVIRSDTSLRYQSDGSSWSWVN